MNPRCTAYVRIPGARLIEQIRVIEPAVPGSSQIVGATWDGEEIALLIQSPHLDEIPVGESVPVLRTVINPQPKSEPVVVEFLAQTDGPTKEAFTYTEERE